MSVGVEVKSAPASLVFTGMAILTSAGIGSQFYLAGMAIFGGGLTGMCIASSAAPSSCLSLRC